MTEQLIMERDAEGTTKMGGITFQVPKNRTALGVLTTPGNSIYDGERFGEDGWVYNMRTEEKMRKWFIRFVNCCSSYADARLWEPKLQNIPLLESRRWFFHERAKNKLNPMWPTLRQKIKDAGRFGGYKKFTEQGQGYVIFNKYDGYEDREGISWNWCDKDKPPPVINQALTDEWFYYEWLCSHLYKPFHLYDAAFFRSIEDRYADNKDFSKYYDIKLHLEINGRHYWFARNSGKYAETFFECLAKPEDTHYIEEKL